MNVSPLSEVSGRGTEQNNLFKIVEGKEINVNRSSDCDGKMKVGVCEGRVKTVAMGAQRVINPDNIGHGSIELKEDKGVANPEGLICENSCEEKYTLGTLMGCEKQLTMNRESFRNHTIAKIAGQSNRTLPVVWWRDGQVCPDVDKELWRLGPDGSGVFWRWTSVSRCGRGTMAPWARRLACFGVLCANKKKEEVKRDFGDLRIRKSEGRVVNTPLVFKRVLLRREGEKEETRKEKEQRKGQESPGERTDGRRRRDGKERERGDGKRVGERERVMPALNGEKG
ncbi:uncharacterized protein TNCV_1945581 [Trichonephila clavipes]|nr:uncharacterized protein TNCV_1945581 [Trichonephila clavipes]